MGIKVNQRKSVIVFFKDKPIKNINGKVLSRVLP